MPALFLDTAGWFAAVSPREAGHDEARDAYASAATARHRLVTTTLVLAEMQCMLLRWRGPAEGRRFMQLALHTGTHDVAGVDAELVANAQSRWIDRYADRRFSLCDAVSFEVMRRERIKRALTYDRHFSVAGFETL